MRVLVEMKRTSFSFIFFLKAQEVATDYKSIGSEGIHECRGYSLVVSLWTGALLPSFSLQPGGLKE